LRDLPDGDAGGQAVSLLETRLAVRRPGDQYHPDFLVEMLVDRGRFAAAWKVAQDFEPSPSALFVLS